MSVDGTYHVEINTPIGKQEGNLILKAEGTKLTGRVEASIGQKDFTGSVSGNDVAWSVEISSPLGKMKLDFKGAVSGGNISGEVKTGSFGTSRFTGKKL
jgi:aerobic carbon-monoxide dehydrogenase large subunit